MNKNVLFFSVFCLFCATSYGQSSKNKMLFVIDSIPLFNDPEEWNPVLPENIADIKVITNKDTLALLGYEKLDGVTYLFTKEYRNRADSLKQIPGLKQMEMKNDVWYLHNIPYNGKYINYYNSGIILDEGTLLNGKPNGELTVYYKNGKKKSVGNYKDGILNGVTNDYYKNGALRQTRAYSEGKNNGVWKTYFINGQIESGDLKKGDRYDTMYNYFSTGKIRAMRLIKNGRVIPAKNTAETGYLTGKYYESLNRGDTKTALKYCSKLIMLDNTNTDAYYYKAVVMYREYRFDEAITECDKALQIEPLMRETLALRGLARIKKYQFANTQALSKEKKIALLASDDIISIPDDEQEKICSDLQQADYLNSTEDFRTKLMGTTYLSYCQKKSSH